MDSRFISAFTDPTPDLKILGRFVSPFSLAHRVILTALDSPLLHGGAEIRPVDLLIAVKVCAGEPIGKLSLRDMWTLNRLNDSKTMFYKELHRFEQFVLVESWPKFWRREGAKGSSSDSGPPWVLSIVCNLISNGIPEDRAWNMPEAQAIWYNTTFAILKGADLSIITEKQEKAMEALG